MSEAVFQLTPPDRLMIQAAERRPNRVLGVDTYARAWEYIFRAREAYPSSKHEAHADELAALEKLREFIDIEADDPHPAALTETYRAYTVAQFLPLLAKLPISGERPSRSLKRQLNSEYADGLYGELGIIADHALYQLDQRMNNPEATAYELQEIDSLIGYLMEHSVEMIYARHQSVAFMAFPADPASDTILRNYSHDVFLCDLRSKNQVAYAPFQIKFQGNKSDKKRYGVPIITAHDIGNDLNAHGDGKILGTLRLMVDELHGKPISREASRYLTDISTYLADKYAKFVSPED